VVSDFAVDAQRLCDGVGIVGQGHKLCDAVVDGDGSAVGEGQEEGLGEGEGGTEDGGVDALMKLVSVIVSDCDCWSDGWSDCCECCHVSNKNL
jgi:hypothetical protein